MPHESVDALLRSAIAQRRLIRFDYQGRERIVEPHDYGVKGGAASLLAFQVDGASSSSLPGWRMFRVPQLRGLVLLPDTFPGSRGAEHREHYAWDVLFARVR